ncbi:hypothetical protein K1719_005925 [Acacia pycnantha]|nr:hypothetical protein K1719_005925 [Acacia pycnantha]
MGCGKSKHDVVASGNTVLKRKKSSVKCNCKDQETGAQTKADDNINNVNVNNVGNVNSGEEVQKDGNNNVVKEVVVGGKVENATSVPEETVLQKKDDLVVAGENNGNVEEEKVVEKKSEEVVAAAAAEPENKTEKTDVEEVKEEETKNKEVGDGEEGLVLKEVSEEDGALKLNENDQKVNDDAPVEEENKNGELIDEVSVKEETVAKEEAPEDIINVAASEGEEKDLKAEEQKENNLSKEDEKAN